jgi:hypothetical protein
MPSLVQDSPKRGIILLLIVLVVVHIGLLEEVCYTSSAHTDATTNDYKGNHKDLKATVGRSMGPAVVQVRNQQHSQLENHRSRRPWRNMSSHLMSDCHQGFTFSWYCSWRTMTPIFQFCWRSIGRLSKDDTSLTAHDIHLQYPYKTVKERI